MEFRLQRLLPYVLAFACGFLLYLNTATLQFAWDDSIVILENERVQQGIAGIPLHFHRYTSDQLQDRYGFRPVTLIVFSVEYQFFGKSPGPYHLVNACLFGLCCLVFFMFASALFGKENLLPAWLATLLFAAHPVHTEAVANIKSLDEILAFLFGILSLLAVQQGLKETRLNKKLFFIASAALLFILAFLSKENAAGLALVWLLIALLMPGLSIRQRLSGLLPFAAAAVAALGIYAFSASSTTGKELTQGMGIVTEGRILGNSIFYTESKWEVAAFSFRLLAEYLRLCIFPWPLRYYYGYNQIPVTGWTHPLVILSLLVYAGLLLLAWLKRKTNWPLSLGILLYFSSLVLYLHLIKALDDTLAERFLFLPSAGFCIAIAALFPKRMFAGNDIRASLTKNKWIAGAFAVVLVLFSVHTFSRNLVWKNNLSLFSHDMPYLNECARAHFNLASEMEKQYRTDASKRNLLPEILKHYRETVRISSDAYYARLALGELLISEGKIDEGVSHLEAAAKQYPHEGRAWFWLGRGKYFQKKYTEAIYDLSLADSLSPNRLDTRFFLAWSHFFNGQQHEAIRIMKDNIHRSPGTWSYYDALSDFYFGINEADSGFAELEKVIVQNPGMGDAWHKMLQRKREGGDVRGADSVISRAAALGIRLQ